MRCALGIGSGEGPWECFVVCPKVLAKSVVKLALQYSSRDAMKARVRVSASLYEGEGQSLEMWQFQKNVALGTFRWVSQVNCGG